MYIPVIRFGNKDSYLFEYSQILWILCLNRKTNRSNSFALLSTFAIFDCFASKIAWSRHSSSKGEACLCSRLSLSLAVAEDRMRFGHAKLRAPFAWLSTFTIFASLLSVLLPGRTMPKSFGMPSGIRHRPPGIEVPKHNR